MRCPSCLAGIDGDFSELAEHIFDKQASNDSDHIMWINRYVSKKRASPVEFAARILETFQTEDLKNWIIKKFVAKFYSPTPHHFILNMQRPGKWTLLGYAYEHHHFLKQWVRSCASIISRSDDEDVQHYEIDNILSEWQGVRDGIPSHHELLLRMGESYGASREDIYKTVPLDPTKKAVKTWDRICRDFSFVEGMSAMHSLELIANRKIVQYGASIGYFDPAILKDGSVTKETVDFLREGYEADVSHSEIALDLIVKYAKRENLVQEAQAVFMRSIEEFDNYLNARIERGVMLEDKQH